MSMVNNTPMPVFFIGHGDPRNAILDNPFTQSLKVMGESLAEKPRAILVVSAHWMTSGVYVSVTPKPEIIYDFWGFPDELYQVKYPAPGAPEYAKELTKLLPFIKDDLKWGLDHGAWTILKHLFPKADIPVFQLSIDIEKPMQYHFDLAKELKPLREKGVMVIGSGNIVHNLRLWFSRDDMHPFEWTLEFDNWVKEKIDRRDFQSLIHYEQQGRVAQLAVPTMDHYVPMLYSLALADQDERISYTYEEVFSAASMRCFKIG